MGSRLVLRALKRSLRPVTFRLEGGKPVLEDLVEIGHAVLNQPVEPFELIFGVGHLPLQCDNRPLTLSPFRCAEQTRGQDQRQVVPA